jgi:hypothetical protein
MKKLEEEIEGIIGSNLDINRGSISGISTASIDVCEYIKEISIEFHQYILNVGAMKTGSGDYVINGVGSYSPNQLFENFIEQRYK